MPQFRYPLRSDWPFYLLLLSYGYLIVSMTYGLWFGGGVNIFASYSDAGAMPDVIIDANKVYWSKTCFLFGILFLVGFNVDFRAAAGICASFWAGSLMLMFGPTPNLIGAFVMGVLILGLQVWRRQIFASKAP